MKTNETSDRSLKILSALSVVVVGLLCGDGAATTGRAQGAPATQSPQLQEIVKLTQAKMSDDVILQYIKNSGASYNLSADDILYLNGQGVSQPVISALLANKSSAPAPLPVSAPTPAPAPVAPLVAPSTPAPQISPYPGAAPVTSYPAPAVSDVAEQPPTTDISLSYFQGQLAPYGSWVEVPGQGPCWVPTVQTTVPDWRPYFNDGHWIYTDEGLTWQSDYPWGQYAFHYGRWFRDAHFGWMWRPGYNWGPAWVSWRQADAEGYCGWAPLPPGARFETGVGIVWNGQVAVDTDFGMPPDMYVFVPFNDFWMHDYVAFRAPLWRVPVLFHSSLVVNHFGFVGGHFFFGGWDRARLGLLTHHDIFVDRLAIHDDHILRAREFERTHYDAHGFDHGRPGAFHDDHGHDSHFGRDHGF